MPTGQPSESTPSTSTTSTTDEATTGGTGAPIDEATTDAPNGTGAPAGQATTGGGGAGEMVRSADGTRIAYERTGAGPAVVLIGGAFNDRSTTAALAAELAPRFTVYRYDRRGRGDSGDTSPPMFAAEREIEDLAAVLAVAAAHAAAGVAGVADQGGLDGLRRVAAVPPGGGRAGRRDQLPVGEDQPHAAGHQVDGQGPVGVFGHSSGAVLALEAAARGLPIARLAVYEAPFIVDGTRPRPGADIGDRLAELVAADRRTDTVRLFLTESVSLPAEMVEMMQGSPNWPDMEALAHSLPYDAALFEPGLALPADRYSAIAVPTLAVDGTASPPWMRNAVRALAEVIPRAEHVSLEGQDHGILNGPAPLVPLLERFFGA